MKTKTWLPLFSGFYGTIWETDGDESNELYSINETRKEKGLPPVEWDAVEWDYAGYIDTVSRMFTRYVQGELKALGMADAVEFEELRSPREYNFTNDSINAEVVFTKDNVKNVERYIKEHKNEFSKYLVERYTSRSGFFSSYSPDIEDWSDAADILSHAHKAGAVLDFILQNEDINEMDIYERVTSNGGTLNAKNFDELTERPIMRRKGV